MIVVVPADTPVITPADPAIATEVLLLLHVPPAVALLSEVVNPAHTLVFPDIATGNAFIVTATVAWQPVGNK